MSLSHPLCFADSELSWVGMRNPARPVVPLHLPEKLRDEGDPDGADPHRNRSRREAAPHPRRREDDRQYGPDRRPGDGWARPGHPVLRLWRLPHEAGGRPDGDPDVSPRPPPRRLPRVHGQGLQEVHPGVQQPGHLRVQRRGDDRAGEGAKLGGGG